VVSGSTGWYRDLPIEDCPVCGTSEPACGYDDEGRPYVHTDPVDADDEVYDLGAAVEDVDTGGLT
jgi:hypothetical protein